MLFTAVVSAAPVLLVRMNLETSPLNLLLLTVLPYVFSYACFSRITGVVKWDDWRYLFRGLRP